MTGLNLWSFLVAVIGAIVVLMIYRLIVGGGRLAPPSHGHLIDQRTGVANSLRSQLAEFGVIERKGIENVGELVRMLDEDDQELAKCRPVRSRS